MKKLFALIKKFWRWFRSPSKIAIGTLIIVSALGGIFSWVGFNYGLEQTNTEKFCISCHSNDVWQEYIHTSHYQNRSGVSASCPDCHVPHEFGPKIWRKIVAAREVYAWNMGYTDTIEKFNARRQHMAEREWERMKSNDSQECRNCHNMERMDYSAQKEVAKRMHTMAQETGKTCIDCHKGIAHDLPNMADQPSGFAPQQNADKKEEAQK